MSLPPGWLRGRRRGKPHGKLGLVTTFAERYHDKIVSQGEHQLWTGAMKADGVGVLKWNGKACHCAARGVGDGAWTARILGSCVAMSG